MGPVPTRGPPNVPDPRVRRAAAIAGLAAAAGVALCLGARTTLPESSTTSAFRYMHTRTVKDPERRRLIDPNAAYSSPPLRVI